MLLAGFSELEFTVLQREGSTATRGLRLAALARLVCALVFAKCYVCSNRTRNFSYTARGDIARAETFRNSRGILALAVSGPLLDRHDRRAIVTTFAFEIQLYCRREGTSVRKIHKIELVNESIKRCLTSIVVNYQHC